MARIFKDFDKITMGDFTPFTKGYHLLTITGHKEDVSKKGQDTDVFEVMSDTEATMNITLYFGEKTQWTYKKLLHSCGAKTDDMKGNQTVDFSKLIGKRFGAFIDIEEVESWSEEKGQTVTKRYPRANASKFYTEEKTMELMEKEAQQTVNQCNQEFPSFNIKGNYNTDDDMVQIDDEDIPF